jgi:hypothetical protein
VESPQRGEGNSAALHDRSERKWRQGRVGQHLTVADVGEGRGGLTLPFDPVSSGVLPFVTDQVILAVLDGARGRKVEAVTLHPERLGVVGVWRCGVVTHYLGRPGTRKLGLRPLLAEMRLPETIEKSVRKPLQECPGLVGRGREDRLPLSRVHEPDAIQFGVPEVGVGVPMGEPEAGQMLRQVRGECADPAEVEHDLRQADLPKRLIPGTIALGAFTFTMTALPGTPAIQNAIPMPHFGTTPFAAPGLGILTGIVMFAFGLAWLQYRARQAAGEGYGHDCHRSEGSCAIGRPKKARVTA